MLRRLRGWLRAILRHDAVEGEMQEEMRLHLERKVERLMARGLGPEAARAEAMREFGNLGRIQEEARDARGVQWIESALQDARYAVRGLRLKPGFAFAVIATLGLGVGANATMFGIVDRLMLRPPRYLVGPERSHHFYFGRSENGVERLGQAAQYRRYLDLAEGNSSMDVVAAFAPRQLAVGAGDIAEEAVFGAASASLWKLFDARPALGRFFTAEEDRDTDGARVAVLSYSYWQSRYGGSPDVLGSTIVIRPAQYTVIGVAPRGFAGVALETPDVFIPIAMAALDDFGPAWATARAEYSMTWLEVYGRRKPGVTLEAAEADLSAAYRASYRKQIEMEPGTAPIDLARPRVVLGSMLAERGPAPSANSRIALWLLGVTGIVLLIACANAGNLLLARALGRRREIAVRVALGVSRGRLLRQLLIESMVVAVLGTVAGLLLAQWGGQLLRTFLMNSVEWDSPIADRRVLLFTTVTAVFAGLLAGLAPMLQAGRSDQVAALKTGARDGEGRRSRIRAGLMLVQVALSVILLIGTGLFVRSFTRVGRVHLGYDAGRLLVVQVRLRNVELDSTQQVALRHALLDRARQNPAVEGATLAYSVPFSGTRSRRIFVAGVDSTSRLGEFIEQAASPGYFTTVGTRLLTGRDLLPEDGPGAPLVAVVSADMAKVLWPRQNAIGQCFRTRTDGAPCRTVVGIAENVKQASLGSEAAYTYYLPARQAGEFEGRLILRIRGEAESQREAIRRDLQGVMPSAGYLAVRPMARVVSQVTRSWRLGSTLFAVFGSLALVLASIGLYSVVAYSVAQRKHEVGVRIALGAKAGNVVGLVMRDGLRVVLAGVAVGAGVALAAGQWLSPLLFQVSPRDPWVFGAVTGVLVIVALIASGVPALRATRVDPATVLRED